MTLTEQDINEMNNSNIKIELEMQGPVATCKLDGTGLGIIKGISTLISEVASSCDLDKMDVLSLVNQVTVASIDIPAESQEQAKIMHELLKQKGEI